MASELIGRLVCECNQIGIRLFLIELNQDHTQNTEPSAAHKAVREQTSRLIWVHCTCDAAAASEAVVVSWQDKHFKSFRLEPQPIRRWSAQLDPATADHAALISPPP